MRISKLEALRKCLEVLRNTRKYKIDSIKMQDYFAGQITELSSGTQDVIFDISFYYLILTVYGNCGLYE